MYSVLILYKYTLWMINKIKMVTHPSPYIVNALCGCVCWEFWRLCSQQQHGCLCTPLHYYCSHHVVCCSSELIRLVTEGLCPLPSSSHSPFPQPWQPPFYCFYEIGFFLFFSKIPNISDTLQYLSFSVGLFAFEFLTYLDLCVTILVLISPFAHMINSAHQWETAHLLVILHNFINREAVV